MARKRSRPFCQKCRWQVTPKHANTLDPTNTEWADYAAVKAWCGNLPGNELTRNLSRNTRSQSSQLAEPLWTDPGLKSGISVRELIYALKKKIIIIITAKDLQAGNELSNILPKSSHARKKPPPLSLTQLKITFRMPPVPLLSQPEDVQESWFCNRDTIHDMSRCLKDLCLCTHRLRVQTGQVKLFLPPAS